MFHCCLFKVIERPTAFARLIKFFKDMLSEPIRWITFSLFRFIALPMSEYDTLASAFPCLICAIRSLYVSTVLGSGCMWLLMLLDLMVIFCKWVWLQIRHNLLCSPSCTLLSMVAAEVHYPDKTGMYQGL